MNKTYVAFIPWSMFNAVPLRLRLTDVLHRSNLCITTVDLPIARDTSSLIKFHCVSLSLVLYPWCQVWNWQGRGSFCPSVTNIIRYIEKREWDISISRGEHKLFFSYEWCIVMLCDAGGTSTFWFSLSKTFPKIVACFLVKGQCKHLQICFC